MTAWWEQAVCRGTDTDMFPDTAREQRTVAKLLCADCPVKAECLRDALRLPTQHGVRGGLTAGDRRKLMTGQVARTANCGTNAGYHAHRRRGEIACKACKAACAATSKAFYQRKRDKLKLSA